MRSAPPSCDGLVAVEARRRLVEQHDRRTGGEGPGDLDAAGGPQREHRRADVGDAAQVEQVEQVIDAGALRVGLPVERARGDEVAPEPAALVAHAVAEHDVLAHGEAHEQLELLERAGETEARPLRRRRAGDLLAAEEDVALLRAQQPGEHVEQRGLAGAVGADEADDARRRDRQADVAHRDQPAEAHGHVARLDRRASRLPPASAAGSVASTALMTA